MAVKRDLEMGRMWDRKTKENGRSSAGKGRARRQIYE